MRISLPPAVLHIVHTIQNAGFTCEIVGGAVRDLLLNKPTTDWDFTTNATPEQLLPLFTESFYENTYGTVMVAHKHLAEQFNLHDETEPDLIYDMTTYRSDGEYRNHRQPESVAWGTSIEEDLQRRDFTINAMALRLDDEQKNPDSVEAVLIDPYQGEQDLEAKLIRTVGDAYQRFHEDALRMLRAVRFSVQLGFTIEEQTKQAIHKHAVTLQHISAERIRDELLKILASNDPEGGIRTLDNLGLLSSILPELLETKGIRQSGHHIYDVWEHSVRALGTCPSPDPIVRLATLLHDIAKPVTAVETKEGTVTFYNHEVVGARIARDIARRLHLSKSQVDKIFMLVRWHMFTYEQHVTDAYIRRFIRRVGVENISDMMALRTGDRVGSGSKATSWRLEELQQRIYDQLHQPLQVKDLLIDGNDVMQELQLKPGPQIGKTLNVLFEDVLDNPEHNTREYLLEQLPIAYKKAVPEDTAS